MALTLNNNKTKKKTVRVPNKRSINLVGVGEKPINPLVAIPAILLILLAAALLSKFAVVDRLVAVSRAQAHVSRLQTELDQTYDRIRGYGELEAIYAHYTYSGMTQDELERADRVAAMDLLSRVVLPRAEVTSWTVRGNQLIMTMYGESLQEINLIAQSLEEEEMVDFCKVTSAATTRLNERGEELPYVTAQVTAYLLAS